MFALRLIIGAICIALGTVMVGWWAVPIVAFLFGILARGSKTPGLAAALAAALAWGGYLAITAFGGAPISTFATRLALSLQLPTWGPWIATLTFPALLAGLASYLGARAGSHYLSTP